MRISLEKVSRVWELYVIQSGRVKLVHQMDNDRRREVATLKAGDFFGELALLDEIPRSYTAIAIEKTEVLALFRPDFFDIIDKNCEMGAKINLRLAQLIGENLRHTESKLKELEYSLIKTRCSTSILLGITAIAKL
jgi:CRP-like cAMP-binding protein